MIRFYMKKRSVLRLLVLNLVIALSFCEEEYSTEVANHFGLPAAFQKPSNGPFSIYSLLNDQMADESHQSPLFQHFLPSTFSMTDQDLSSLSSENSGMTINLPEKSHNASILDSSTQPEILSTHEPIMNVRAPINMTAWPKFKVSHLDSDKEHGPSAAPMAMNAEPSLEHSNNPYEQYLPKLPFQRQSNPTKQQDLLKTQSTDHVHDILNRFRQNYSQPTSQKQIQSLQQPQQHQHQQQQLQQLQHHHHQQQQLQQQQQLHQQHIQQPQMHYGHQHQMLMKPEPSSSPVPPMNRLENDKFDEHESENENDNFDETNTESSPVMDMQQATHKEKVKNMPMMRLHRHKEHQHPHTSSAEMSSQHSQHSQSSHSQQRSPPAHVVKFKPNEMKHLDDVRSTTQSMHDRNLPEKKTGARQHHSTNTNFRPQSYQQQKMKFQQGEAQRLQQQKQHNANDHSEDDHKSQMMPEKTNHIEKDEVVEKSPSEDSNKKSGEKVEKVVQITEMKLPPDMMFNDHIYITGPPPLFNHRLRPRPPFASPFSFLQPSLLPLSSRFAMRPLVYPTYPMHYPRYVTVDDSSKYTLEPNADTNKPEHVEPDSTQLEHEGIGERDATGYPLKGGVKGQIAFNEIDDNSGHHPPGMMPYPMGPMAGTYYPGMMNRGSMVTCCKTFYQPPPGHHREAAEGHATSSSTATARGDGIATSASAMMGSADGDTICMRHDQVNPFLMHKQLKLQKLLYPFLMKKRILFG